MSPTVPILLTYLIALFAIAWYVSRNSSLAGYQVNERSTTVWTLSLSHFASMAGAGGTVAIVAEVYRTGVSFGLALPVSFCIGAGIMALVSHRINKLGRAIDATNIADFFRHRFDNKNAVLVTVIQVVLLLLWTATQAVAFGSLVTVLTGVSMTVALAVGMLATVAYTLLGGLQIDLVSDVIQTCIIAIVFITMTFIAWHTAPSQLTSRLPQGHLDPFNYGGVSWFIGIILFSGFIYLGNTSHWQRILSADKPEVARRSYLYVIPVLVLLAAAILYLGLYGTVQLQLENADTALFRLMKTLLPPPVFGIGLAAVLAIIMSSIDSLLIGGGTIVYQRWLAPILGEKLVYARMTTAVFGIAGFAVAYRYPDIVSLGLALVYLALVLVPATFALLYTDVSRHASFLGMVVGLLTLALGYSALGKDVFLLSIAATCTVTFGPHTIKRNV